jgi:hypothetical protein
MSGLPAHAMTVGVIILGSLPVWAAAKMTGAGNATLLRSAIALFVGTGFALASLSLAGGWAFILAPVAYLLAFKFILDTSILGSIVLSLLALAGYAAMIKMFGAGFSIS